MTGSVLTTSSQPGGGASTAQSSFKPKAPGKPAASGARNSRMMLSSPRITSSFMAWARAQRSRLLDELRKRIAELLAHGFAAHVARAHIGLGQQLLDGAHDGARRLRMPQMLEHHGAGPDLADGIGDSLAGDVGRTAVHRLEHGGEFTLRIDVAAGRDGDGA